MELMAPIEGVKLGYGGDINESTTLPGSNCKKKLT